ncbi:hypothetical protein [uncultured Fusobacterium sp.]|uniref:hypothetical protein n=1 Tax=uncultured Fusobacterium sp. TaxID=159267 RepID=UPI0025E3C791|nr:hypothetical protein [uncultured Fusobacterium sp.]
MGKNSKVLILTGNTGSGKTEFSIQYSLFLAKQKKKINLVDLDVINVYYRSRENKEMLEKLGIKIWGSSNFDYNGSDLPAISYGFESLLNEKKENVVVDLAGSINGLKLLTALKNKNFIYDMWLICNIYREETDNEEKIIHLIKEYENFSGFKITGIINNSNLLEYSTEEDLITAEKTILNVSHKLNIPAIYTVLLQKDKDVQKKLQNKNIFYIDKLFNRKSWMK